VIRKVAPLFPEGIPSEQAQVLRPLLAQHRSEVPPKEGGINSSWSSTTPSAEGVTGERPAELLIVNGEL